VRFPLSVPGRGMGEGSLVDSSAGTLLGGIHVDVDAKQSKTNP
jgi:hypothetical protein